MTNFLVPGSSSVSYMMTARAGTWGPGLIPVLSSGVIEMCPAPFSW